MVTNANPTEWLAAMREIEHDGDIEFDMDHDELWNAAGSRAQAVVDELRQVPA